ncbi:MAG: cob(I)yrinic acid a,c-diamide adenosyltransferase [Nitrospinae bacterium]|nr:cob(I)yrinic acid a,c-diamide adenosyltransferase [Nitrospinota bacterium]
MREEVKGLTVIFTGNGKGKTSAALGAVMRALGHGWKCKVIQFIKANRETGEILLLKKLAPELGIEQFGMGFTWLKDHSPEEHREAAQAGFNAALADIRSGKYGLMVLDEILYALGKGLVSLADVQEAIRQKPSHMHLILTGRGAPQELIEMADMVTSMEPVKHPMEKGIPAQRGLDF